METDPITDDQATKLKQQGPEESRTDFGIKPELKWVLIKL